MANPPKEVDLIVIGTGMLGNDIAHRFHELNTNTVVVVNDGPIEKLKMPIKAPELPEIKVLKTLEYRDGRENRRNRRKNKRKNRR